MLVMAWACGRISTLELLKNWLVVYVSNFIGAVGLVLLVYFADHPAMNDGAVAFNAVRIAAAKTSLPFVEALFRGILCNILVCLAVWLAMAGRSVTDKIMAIVFPISAFVAAGFEHSVANMYFIPLGIALRDAVPAAALASVDVSQLTWVGFAQNLLPVTIGNIIGGGLLVAAVYMVVYRRAEIRGRLERRQS